MRTQPSRSEGEYGSVPDSSTTKTQMDKGQILRVYFVPLGFLVVNYDVMNTPAL